MATAVAIPPVAEIIQEQPVTEARARLPRVGPAAPPDVPLLYRLSIEQYEAMAKAGILDHDDKVELVDGFLANKMGKNGPHRVATGLAFWILARLLPDGWHVAQEAPIRIPGRAGEPEPDLSVVRGEIRDYLRRHPNPDEVALVVEASESSLRVDRGIKRRMYAGGGIATYWVIDLVDQQLEVYTEPDVEAGEYRSHAVFKPGDSVTFVLDGVVLGPIAVADLLP